ncbi:MAG: hypothetical protein D6803_00695 [Anaerolineae bacterium]|nr:MAG: hypothetical protein D6803_00695 [Anaerolineae bacterium]
MKRLWPRKHTIDLATVEARLAESLTPVQPRPAYVQDLRTRLMNEFNREHTGMQITSSLGEHTPRGWLLAGGIIGSAVMLVVGIRGLFSLAGLLGLLLHHRQTKPPLPATPAN